MLAFVLRGIVLVTVLSWYSTSMWKMIDGYFKNRFDKYLREEFEKNPRMKADMVDNNRAKEAPNKIATPQEVLDSCQLDKCEVDKVEVLEGDKISPAGVKEGQTNHANGEENMSNVSPDGDNLRNEEKKEKIDTSASSPPDAKRTKTTTRVRKKIVPTQESGKSKKEKKIKTITLTEEDFQEVKKKMAIDDYDFTEFEYEEQPTEGIPVSKLGFKPRADIGNIDRVTEDEFCPISLDYEGDCRESKKWP